jgi:hypothetical protein
MTEHIFALNEQDKPVNIEDAKPFVRKMYFCPECKSEMVVKNQGKIKEHHFAHYNGNGGEGESPAHSNFVLFLLDLLTEYLESSNPFVVRRVCNENAAKVQWVKDAQHNLFHDYPALHYSLLPFYYDILKDVAQIKREYVIPGTYWRPDLALLDSGGKVIRVVEVVFTHEDDPRKTEYYIENKIDVLRVEATDNLDEFRKLTSYWKKESPRNLVLYCNASCKNLEKVVIPALFVSNAILSNKPRSAPIEEFVKNPLPDIELINYDTHLKLDIVKDWCISQDIPVEINYEENTYTKNDFSKLHWNIKVCITPDYNIRLGWLYNSYIFAKSKKRNLVFYRVNLQQISIAQETIHLIEQLIGSHKFQTETLLLNYETPGSVAIQKTVVFNCSTNSGSGEKVAKLLRGGEN